MPYLTYTCCWQLRYKELRLGHGSMVERKTESGDELEGKVKEYGLKARHHVLLEGITFPPEIKATIAQSVGPMTTLISLAREAKGSRYGKKHRDAAARAFAHVPGIEQIIKVLEGTKAREAASLISSLGELSILIPPRNQRRAYFSLAMFAYAALSDEEIEHYTVKYERDDKKKLVMTKQPGLRHPELDPVEVDKMEKEVAHPIHYLKCWDMSGKGAMQIYKRASEREAKWVLPSTSKMNAAYAAQARFHAIWGTFSEDMSLLGWMTDVKVWTKRRDMGEMFSGSGSATEETEITLPKLTKYSKLASSNISGLMTETNDQVSANPVWAGKRAVKF